MTLETEQNIDELVDESLEVFEDIVDGAVEDGKDRTIFLDAGIFWTPLFDNPLTRPHFLINPKFGVPDNSVSSLIMLRAQKKLYDEQLNKFLIKSNERYIDTLFDKVVLQPNVFISSPTMYELDLHMKYSTKTLAFNRGRIGIKQHKNLTDDRQMMDYLNDKLKDLPRGKVVDFGLFYEAEEFREKHRTRAGVADVEMYLNAVEQARARGTEAEIWFMDGHMPYLAKVHNGPLGARPYLHMRLGYSEIGKDDEDSRERKEISLLTLDQIDEIYGRKN